MAETLLQFKTGTMTKLGSKDTNGNPTVPIKEGTVYFAIDNDKGIGQIVYDAPDGKGGTKRVVMSTWAEKADKATSADIATSADSAKALATSTHLEGMPYNGANEVIHYTTCATAGNTVAKVASVANGFVLKAGSRVIVKFTNANTVDSPTLNVNGTGAKPICVRGAAMSANKIHAGEVHEYVYDGTNWELVGSVANDTIVYVDDASGTLYITSQVSNGDEVSY